MNSMRILALVLIVAGALGLAYGGFTYTTKTHQTTIGPLDVAVNEKQTVDVPVWAGVAAIALGGVLLLTGGALGRKG